MVILLRTMNSLKQLYTMTMASVCIAISCGGSDQMVVAGEGGRKKNCCCCVSQFVSSFVSRGVWASTQGFLLARAQRSLLVEIGGMYMAKSKMVPLLFSVHRFSYSLSFLYLPPVLLPFFPLSLLPLPSQLGIKTRSVVCKASAPSAIL